MLCWLQSRPAFTAMYLLLFAAACVANPPVEARSERLKSEVCGHYDPNPECTEDMRNALRKKFGLPTLNQIRQRHGRAGRGEVVVGIIKIKTGESLGLLFQRDRDGVPSVEVHRTQWNGKELLRYRPLQAKIPEATWNEILAKGKALDLVVAREEVYTCGAAFTIELVDQKGNVRAPVGDSCGDEPRGVYFETLAEAAIAQLPHCAALVPAYSDRAVDKLLECHFLQGDKMIAAELYNFLENLPDNRSFWVNMRWSKASDMKALLAADDIHFEWPGLPIMRDPDAIAEFLTGPWLYPFEFDYRSIDARTPDDVEVQGCIFFAHDDNFRVYDAVEGPFIAVWTRGADRIFRLRYFEVPAAHPRRAPRAKGDRTALSVACPREEQR